MAEEKAYTIIVTRTQEVEVFAKTPEAAQRYVKRMYEGGDACADLEDATYVTGRVRTMEEVERDQ